MRNKELKVLNLAAHTFSTEAASEQTEACCAPVAKLAVGAAQLELAANLFAALADTTRLTILHLLAQSEGEVCVCDITASFKLGQPTISHHLKILREAGLITGDKRGKWVYYSLVANRATEVRAALDQIFKVALPTTV